VEEKSPGRRPVTPAHDMLEKFFMPVLEEMCPNEKLFQDGDNIHFQK
jgi:hypothetical protein